MVSRQNTLYVAIPWDIVGSKRPSTRTTISSKTSSRYSSRFSSRFCIVWSGRPEVSDLILRFGSDLPVQYVRRAFADCQFCYVMSRYSLQKRTLSSPTLLRPLQSPLGLRYHQLRSKKVCFLVCGLGTNDRMLLFALRSVFGA